MRSRILFTFWDLCGRIKRHSFDSNFIDKVTGYKDPRIAKTDVEKFRCEDKIYTIPPQELLSVIDDYCSFEDGKYNFYSPEETVKRAYGRLNAPKKENYSLRAIIVNILLFGVKQEFMIAAKHVIITDFLLIRLPGFLA